MSDPLIYTRLEQIDGPLVMLQVPRGAIGFGERVLISDRQGRARLGRVVLLDGERVTVEVFEGTAGLAQRGCRVRFMGEPISLQLDPSLLGRRLDGAGAPIDGGPPLRGPAVDINGRALNPTARAYPRSFIQTGLTSIDVMNALVRGQKLPIFSSSGLPHDQLAIQIAQQARVRPDLRTDGAGQVGDQADEQLVVVFAAIGVKHDVAVQFAREITGQTVTFLNLADDPVMERLLTPRMALCAAEYLAYELGYQVLVILTDMTVYGEALREIATARGDLPSRKGYPGYLYSDLAALYERAGKISGKPGSITQIPILTMPNDDITHPIPDLTGYITEGQIVLSRDLNRQGVYPPVELLPSLSRLMNDGVGHGHTRDDHRPLMEQLYAAYARCDDVRMMTRIMGEEDLSDTDRRYLSFGRRFEATFVAQGRGEERTIEKSLETGWDCLTCLPQAELTRLDRGLLRAQADRWESPATAPERG